MAVRRCFSTLTWRMPWRVPLDPQSALISPKELANDLNKENDIILLDSTVLIASKATGFDTYAKQRIPGAAFLDLDLIGDTTFSPAPHNLPTVDRFKEEMYRLGIKDIHTKIVLYDTLGLFSSPRAWFTFIAMGHDQDKVFVLDGGLPVWKRDGFELETSKPLQARAVGSRRYEGGWAFKHKTMQWGLMDVLKWMESDSAGFRPLLDARSNGRFHGTAPEPRAGVRGGHIPASRSVPFTELLRPDGTLRPREELRQIFSDVGAHDMPQNTPAVVHSCGSGLTAAILALALHEIGLPVTQQAIYDGSWTEWGGRTDTPVSK